MFWDPIGIHSVPKPTENIDDILRIPLHATADELECEETDGDEENEENAYIAQVFSLARMNSDTVKKGIPRITMVVAASSRRGPSSPADKISISYSRCQLNHPITCRHILTSMAGINRRYVACSLCSMYILSNKSR